MAKSILVMANKFWIDREVGDPINVAVLFRDNVISPLDRVEQALTTLREAGTGCGLADQLIVQALDLAVQIKNLARDAEGHIQVHERHVLAEQEGVRSDG